MIWNFIVDQILGMKWLNELIVPPERSKKILGRFKGIGANGIAALLGTVTPFCTIGIIIVGYLFNIFQGFII